MLQDIIEDYEIKLDWFFKASMISDLANVSISICYHIATNLQYYALQFYLDLNI